MCNYRANLKIRENAGTPAMEENPAAPPCNCIPRLFLSIRILSMSKNIFTHCRVPACFEKKVGQNDFMASYDVSVLIVRREKVITALTTFSLDLGGLCGKFWVI